MHATKQVRQGALGSRTSMVQCVTLSHSLKQPHFIQTARSRSEGWLWATTHPNRPQPGENENFSLVHSFYWSTDYCIPISFQISFWREWHGYRFLYRCLDRPEEWIARSSTKIPGMDKIPNSLEQNRPFCSSREHLGVVCFSGCSRSFQSTEENSSLSQRSPCIVSI